MKAGIILIAAVWGVSSAANAETVVVHMPQVELTGTTRPGDKWRDLLAAKCGIENVVYLGRVGPHGEDDYACRGKREPTEEARGRGR